MLSLRPCAARTKKAFSDLPTLKPDKRLKKKPPGKPRRLQFQEKFNR